jgi:UDP-2,3-diacylglucosamine pyrophosphatase LpxH
MSSHSESPIILVVSDIHLGASGSNYKRFVRFLEEINRNTGNKWANLKLIMILGDFFDLCMETYEGLTTDDYYNIFSKLDILLETLRKDKKIEVIVLLGNHEIPVVDSYPSPVDNFKHFKQIFFEHFNKAFSKNNRNPKFFNKNRFCQYAILKSLNNGADLILFDSKDDLEVYTKNATTNNYLDKITIDNVNLSHRRMFLFAHGHQFDDDIMIKIGRPLWREAIETDSRPIKRFINCLYNKMVSQTFKSATSEIQLREHIDKELNKEGIKISEILESEIPKKIAEIRNLKEAQYQSKKNDRIKDLETPLFPETKPLGVPLLKRETTFDRIRTFLKKMNLIEITDVIFGHTHVEQQEYEDIPTYENGIEIINDGAWQHNEIYSTYGSILSDGYSRYYLFK